MAECIRFVCSGCGHSIEAWSDGNPFYIDEAGKKKYAYHPHHDELEKCVANDELCPKCGSENVVDTFHLEGAKCPKCKAGHFVRDDDFGCIS